MIEANQVLDALLHPAVIELGALLYQPSRLPFRLNHLILIRLVDFLPSLLRPYLHRELLDL